MEDEFSADGNVWAPYQNANKISHWTVNTEGLSYYAKNIVFPL
mgnify:CR=1 FL=1